MNEYSLDEKHTPKSSSRSIKLRFTDNAIDKAGAFLGGQAAGQAPVHRIMPQASPFQQPPKALPFAQNDEVSEEYAESVEQTEAVSGADERNVFSIFEKDGDDIIAVVSDFKGKTRKEQQQRFALLYVWGYQQVFDKSVPSDKSVLAALRKKEGLYDRNFYGYLDQITKQFLVKGLTGLKVNMHGSKEVDLIIAEINDDDIEGYAYWDTKPGRKRASMNKDDEKEVKEWVGMEVNIGGIDVRSLGNATNHAMFAVWSITRGLRLIDAVKSVMAYAYLTQKYSTVSVKYNAFGKALSQNKAKFSKNPSGLYYLTPEAEGEVESWIRGEPIQVSAEPEVEDTEGEDDE
jgi:hypothetical protein